MLAALSIDKFLAGKPLAITEAGLEELKVHVLARLAAFDAAPKAFLESLVGEMQAATERAAPSSGRPRSGATGVIQIRGTISQHAQGDLSALLVGGASTEGITQALRQLAGDDDVRAIILDIDSPGGSTFGLAELAAEIRDVRAKKPVVAVANSVMASAAYWIGSQADQVYITPGGLVGSVGVFAMHEDISKLDENEGVKVTLISAGKYKTTGNPFEPLPDDARARIQARVDDAYSDFVRDVAKGRGVPESAVRDGYGEGDVVTARQAQKLGMVDGILTLERAIAKAGTLRPTSAGPEGRAELPDVELEANQDNPTPNADEEGQQRLARMRLRSFQARAAAASAV